MVDIKLLHKIEVSILLGLIIFIPLTILPIFPNPYLTPKLIVLVTGILAIMLVKVLKFLNGAPLAFSLGTFDIPLLVLSGAYLASSILRSPNRMDAFFLPGTATIVMSLFFVYLFVNQLEKKEHRLVEGTLFISGLIVSIISLLATADIISSLNILPKGLATTNFNTVGGTLFAAIFLVSLIPIGFAQLVHTKDAAFRALWGVSIAVVLFGAVISVIQLFPDGKSAVQLPDYKTSWFVTVDTLKESPLLGTGPGNYVGAFTKFLPLTYNATDLWQARFHTSHSYFLTVITEVGLPGLAALITIGVILLNLLQNEKKDFKLVGWSTKNRPALASLVLVGISLIFFPADIVVLFVFFIFLALNAKTHSVHFGSVNSANGNVSGTLPQLIISLPVLALIVFVFYRGAKIVSAEYTYQNALEAISTNNGTMSYDLLRKSIEQNPTVDRYHASYAQVNLALANSIASQKDLTEEQRTTIAKLIEQSIREAKATVVLNQEKAMSWELLGNIYRAIIPFAKDADSFAAQAYSQAVNLDPMNPNTRLALGGVYYGAGNFDAAIRVFELAVAVKPDHANAHYNLAFAYKSAGKLDQAINELSNVLSLIQDRESQDFEIAKKALEELQKERDSKKKSQLEAETGNTLTSPEKDDTEGLEPPLDLPEGSEPPATPIPSAE